MTHEFIVGAYLTLCVIVTFILKRQIKQNIDVWRVEAKQAIRDLQIINNRVAELRRAIANDRAAITKETSKLKL